MQKQMIKEKIEENGSDVNGIGKIISKMLGTMIQRKLKFESKIYEEKTEDDSNKTKILDGVDVEINTSTFYFRNTSKNMEERININVSSTEYDNTSKEIKKTLALVEEMVHGQDDFLITDSEFAFGWHFYVVSVNRELVLKLAEQMGLEFEQLKGKGLDKKFLTWLTSQITKKGIKVKFAIKEEMESSKFGIF